MVPCLAGEKKVKQMSSLKGKIWGFKRKEVEDHIANLKKNQEAELEDLSEKIEKFESENETLRDYLSALTEKNATFPTGILLELALKRVERVSGYIEQDVDIEVLAINEITHQKSLVMKNTIFGIEKDIEKVREIIELELKNLMDIAKGQDQKKNINIDVMKNIGKLLSISDWLKSNREDEPDQEKDFCEEESTASAQELFKQMTADGAMHAPMVKPDTTNANIADQNAERHSASEIQISADVIKTDSPKKKENKEKDNKADINSILESSQKGNPQNVDPYFLDSKTDFWGVSVGGKDQTNSSIQEVAVTKDSEIKAGSQVGVREEITAVRAKYILSKVAGEDIMDAAGQLIIRKGEPITVGVMQMARNEGKLADLIINMELPGQEE